MIKKILFTISYLLSILALFFSLYVYSSFFPWLPWSDPCGMQIFVIVFLSSPILLFCGIFNFILSKFGKILTINKFLPFISLLVVFPGTMMVDLVPGEMVIPYFHFLAVVNIILITIVSVYYYKNIKLNIDYV